MIKQAYPHHRRDDIISIPGHKRPARPARCLADACEIQTLSSESL